MAPLASVALLVLAGACVLEPDYEIALSSDSSIQIQSALPVDFEEQRLAVLLDLVPVPVDGDTIPIDSVSGLTWPTTNGAVRLEGSLGEYWILTDLPTSFTGNGLGDSARAPFEDVENGIRRAEIEGPLITGGDIQLDSFTITATLFSSIDIQIATDQVTMFFSSERQEDGDPFVVGTGTCGPQALFNSSIQPDGSFVMDSVGCIEAGQNKVVRIQLFGRLGPPCDEAVDADCDGVLDVVDNCPIVPNPGQENADEDAWGDVCECGDFDGDGFLDTVDARLIQRCSVDEFACAPLCDTTGDGDCNTLDARLVQRFAVGELTKEDLSCAERP